MPGETIAMPAMEPMTIDFPEATKAVPTQCMALEICPDLISEVSLWLNEETCGSEWSWTRHNHYLNNSPYLSATINSLFSTMIDVDYSLRDFRATNITKELVAQLLKTKAKQFLLANVTGVQPLSTRYFLHSKKHYVGSNDRGIGRTCLLI